MQTATAIASLTEHPTATADAHGGEAADGDAEAGERGAPQNTGNQEKVEPLFKNHIYYLCFPRPCSVYE